jgi:hypothetical protein
MRTKLRSKITLLFMSCAVLLTIPAMALADQVANNIDNNVDTTVENIGLQAGGPNGSTGIYVEGTTQDDPNGYNGCNFSREDGTKLVLDVSSSNPNVATVSPAQVELTECGKNNAVPVSIKPLQGGTTTITVTKNAASTVGGNFTLNTATFQVNVTGAVKQDQTINFGALSGKTYGDADFALSATASSGLPVGYAASGDCTVTGGTVHLTGAGNCSITASQGGDATHNPATSVTRTFQIAKANPTIDVKGYEGTYNGDAHGASGSAKGVNGEDLSDLLDLGSKFTDVPGGTAHWTFSGDTNYKDAEGDVNINITKANATIDVKGYTGTYDGDAHGATGTATGVKDEDLSGLLDVGDSFTNAPGGTATWSFAGNTNYNSDSGSVQIVINKATPQITWTVPAAIDYGTALSAAQLNAQADVGGNFTYTPQAATVLKAGTQTLKADFTPNDTTNYNTASKSVTLVVNPYSFTGFFQPIDNGGVLNSAKAGSTIPVKFSLGGDKGMGILAQAPTAGPIKCDPTAAADPLEEVSTATVSSLKYDPTANQYIYNWKTSTSYAGTCQQLVVRLADGTTVKSANFKFTK